MATSGKTIGLNILGLLIIKAISMASSLATIPALLSYFDGNKNLLGTWLAFFTFTAIAISLDLGIGNRLKNDILSRISCNCDYSELITESLGSQFLVSLAISFIVLAGSLTMWSTPDASTEIGRIAQQHPELLIFAIACIVFSMPLRLSYFILQAQQRNAASALLALLPQLAVLLYATIATNRLTPPPDFLALASILLTANVAAYLSPFVFIPDLKINSLFKEIYQKPLSLLFRSQIRKIKHAFPFFLVQIFIIFLYGYNELFYLVAGTTVDIVHYQYYFRPFSLFSVGFSIISLPFWSAIRISQLNKEHKKTRKLFGSILLLNIPVAIATAPLVYFYQDILDAWLGKGAFLASDLMLLIFSISSILTCILHSTSSILSGYDLIRLQAKALGIGLLAKIIILIALIGLRIETDPVMISTTIGLLFVVIIFSLKSIKVWKTYLTSPDLTS